MARVSSHVHCPVCLIDRETWKLALKTPQQLLHYNSYNQRAIHCMLYFHEEISAEKNKNNLKKKNAFQSKFNQVSAKISSIYFYLTEWKLKTDRQPALPNYPQQNIISELKRQQKSDWFFIKWEKERKILFKCIQKIFFEIHKKVIVYRAKVSSGFVWMTTTTGRIINRHMCMGGMGIL